VGRLTPKGSDGAEGGTDPKEVKEYIKRELRMAHYQRRRARAMMKLVRQHRQQARKFIREGKENEARAAENEARAAEEDAKQHKAQEKMHTNNARRGGSGSPN
jgi:hypothetical protein